MFARYMQHTALNCTAIEAEFQVAYGRKVRYDHSLGRVRVNWDNSIKGAKTVKERKERDERQRREQVTASEAEAAREAEDEEPADRTEM